MRTSIYYECEFETLIATSPVEFEFIVAVTLVKIAKCVRRLLEELGASHEMPVICYNARTYHSYDTNY